MDSLESLQNRIKELEEELANEKTKNVCKREKIEEMSSEVVDSNPYRYCTK